MITTETPSGREKLGASILKGTIVDVYQGNSRRLSDVLPGLGIARPNILMIGEPADTERVLANMRSCFETPLASWSPDETPRLPVTMFRTLVVRDVDRLTPAQQENLAALILRSAGDVQIVSTSETPLFSRVVRGVFLERLYYELNVVLLQLRGRHVSRSW